MDVRWKQPFSFVSSLSSVTNASEVWSTDFSPEKLEEHAAQSGMSPGDYSSRFREASERRAITLTVQDSKATLQLKEGTWSLTFDLFKLPCSEARKQLEALMFGLVGCVSSLEKRLAAAEDAAAAAGPCSPEKSQRLLIPGTGGAGLPFVPRTVHLTPRLPVNCLPSPRLSARPGSQAATAPGN
uniref:PAXX non-homologous end joining factor n=1 Tax=Pelodiscus sinensis TaxID=13735 RepID=K7FJJ1_PELSI|nr:protein PAXX [Pelodiscus sinensis]|eukprot:XP_006119842.1 protein PAXX [Pelodiscus sinensis]